jgi:hypothetical protein
MSVFGVYHRGDFMKSGFPAELAIDVIAIPLVSPTPAGTKPSFEAATVALINSVQKPMEI